MSEPIWLSWARKEMSAGVRETPGPRSTPRILQYRDIAKIAINGDDGDIPWCAIGVNAALEANGIHGTRLAGARSFERSPDFVKLAGPALGAIVTKWRKSPTSGLGHVGFYVGTTKSGRVVMLGGNTNDAWGFGAFDPATITGYWWPKSQPLPQQIGAIRTELTGGNAVSEV